MYVFGLYPPITPIGLILRYVRELNRFYNCTKNQLGPQFFGVYFVCFCQVRPVNVFLKTMLKKGLLSPVHLFSESQYLQCYRKYEEAQAL